MTPARLSDEFLRYYTEHSNVDCRSMARELLTLRARIDDANARVGQQRERAILAEARVAALEESGQYLAGCVTRLHEQMADTPENVERVANALHRACVDYEHDANAHTARWHDEDARAALAALAGRGD